ncbi:MAG: helix-turn-helix transcriptional regulator [Phycisphaerales bacterium]|nr:helix-turn-helix transcriptional regulator [Phycisphaerales bacterium]
MKRDGDHHAARHTLLHEVEWRALAERLRLSDREAQLVRGVFDGRNETAIAADLGISVHTVHTYFERLYRKLSVSNRSELLVEVFAAHLSREFERVSPVEPAPHPA